MQLSEEAQAQYRAHIHALQIAQSQVQAQAQALQEHQAMLQAQQTLAAAAAVSTARPSSSMSQHQGKEQSQPSTSTMKPAQKSKNDYDVQLEQLKRRTSSDASNFAPSSLGLGNLSTNDLLLNSPSAFTGPLPLPHQEGFRTGSTGGSSLPAYLNALGGPAVDGSKSGETEAGDALDMETTTRGYVICCSAASEVIL